MRTCSSISSARCRACRRRPRRCGAPRSRRSGRRSCRPGRAPASAPGRSSTRRRRAVASSARSSSASTSRPATTQRAGDRRAMRREQAQQRAQGDALARAGFADQPEHLALAKREVDAVDRMHGALAAKAHGEVADLDDRASIAGMALPSRSLRRGYGPTSDRPCGMPPNGRGLPVPMSLGLAALQTASANGQRVWKRQPDGGLIGIGRVAGDRRFPGPLVGIDRRHRSEQRARVGMARVARTAPRPGPAPPPRRDT